MPTLDVARVRIHQPKFEGTLGAIDILNHEGSLSLEGGRWT